MYIYIIQSIGGGNNKDHYENVWHIHLDYNNTAYKN